MAVPFISVKQIAGLFWGVKVNWKLAGCVKALCNLQGFFLDIEIL
jgi:hypothetical protein